MASQYERLGLVVADAFVQSAAAGRRRLVREIFELVAGLGLGPDLNHPVGHFDLAGQPEVGGCRCFAFRFCHQ